MVILLEGENYLSCLSDLTAQPPHLPVQARVNPERWPAGCMSSPTHHFLGAEGSRYDNGFENESWHGGK